MKSIRRKMLASLLYLWIVPLARGDDLNTVMMEATCKIVGTASVGTGFILGKPFTNNTSTAFYILITADHVLQAIQDETATLVTHQSGPSNTWKRIELTIRIRDGSVPLWKKHPDVDVAGLFLALPTNVVRNLLPTDFLMDDTKLAKYAIHPGMELLCLGYPFGSEANAYGFAILRSGRIASYPLIPTKDIKTFLFDFTVFPGNSGGPVYFIEKDPIYDNVRHIGEINFGIMGLVTQERSITQTTQDLYEKKEKTTPLRLGEVIHASFIKELVTSMGFPTK